MDSTCLDALYEETMAKFDQLFPSLKSTKSTNRKMGFRSHSTIKEKCAHCGKEINKVALIQHSIVPSNISKQLGLENVKVLDLCFTCHRAIHDWNARSVSWVTRDKTNRLKAKRLKEVAKEYEFAYQDFLKNTLTEGFNLKQPVPQLSSV